MTLTREQVEEERQGALNLLETHEAHPKIWISPAGIRQAHLTVALCDMALQSLALPALEQVREIPQALVDVLAIERAIEFLEPAIDDAETHIEASALETYLKACLRRALPLAAHTETDMTDDDIAAAIKGPGQEPIVTALVRDRRRTLTGIAAQLVAGMESDNGCSFFVSEKQAARLNELCGREPMASMTLSHLSTLASGEHGDQLAVLAAHRYGGEQPHDVDEVHALLNDIFEETDAPMTDPTRKPTPEQSSDVRTALAELVRLKDLKDVLEREETVICSELERQYGSMGKWLYSHVDRTDEYERDNPLAWSAARAALAQPEKLGEQ